MTDVVPSAAADSARYGSGVNWALSAGQLGGTSASIQGMFTHPFLTNVGAASTGLGNLVATPFFAGGGMTVDYLDTAVTALYGAGGVVRAGIYQPINQANPFAFASGVPWANLVADAGQVATDGSTGRKIFNLAAALALAPNLWYAIAGMELVSATGTRQIGNGLNSWSPLGVSNGISAYNAQTGLGIQMTGQAGPGMPSVFTPSSSLPFNADAGIGIHRLS